LPTVVGGPESILGPVDLMGDPDEESKKDEKKDEGADQEAAGLIDTSALSNNDGTIDEPVTSGSDTPVTSGSDLTGTDDKKPK
jgi:hypothetical protein